MQIFSNSSCKPHSLKTRPEFGGTLIPAPIWDFEMLAAFHVGREGELDGPLQDRVPFPGQ